MLNNISPKEQPQDPEIPPKQNIPYNKTSNLKDIPQNPSQKYIPSHRDYPRNNPIRERERSRDYEHRQSFHDYQYNIKQSNINNYNNPKNKNPYYRRVNENNQRYEPKYSKEQKNYNNDINISRSFQPMESSKDDCLILLPKNYYNFISKDFDKLKNRLRDETKDDISNIQYDYTVPSYQEYVFRFTTYSFESKSTAIKIISEFLFDSLKKIYDNSKYLRLSFLIPDNVIGFIIGIDGKNINQIRDETNAKIEVFPQNNVRNYRKIEIAGDPDGIAGAANKIYSITKKYFYFNNPKILNRNEREKERDYDIERDRNYNSYKDKGYSSYKKDYNNNYRDREYKGMYNNEKINHNREINYQKDYNYNRNYNSNREVRYRHSNYEKNDYNNLKYKKLYNKESNKYNNVYENNEDSNRENRRSISSKSRSYDRKSFSDRKYDDHNSSYNEDFNRGNFSQDEKLNKPEEKEDGEDVEIEHVENENNEKNENIEKKEDLNKKEEGEIKNDSDNNNVNLINNEENSKKDFEELNNILPEDTSGNLSKIMLCLSSEEINVLNNIKDNNIWINLENEYHCTISKNTKNIDGKENSLITFNGTPKQNSLAIFQLQKYLMDQTNAQSNLENKN